MAKMSDNGRRLLTEWEGKESKVYRDSAGLMTIGVGHLLTKDEITSGKILIAGVPVKYENGLTDQQIDKLLEQDLAWAESAVSDLVRVELMECMRDCLISFIYNIGVSAFKNSTLLKKLNDGEYEKIPDQLTRWNKINGKGVHGLTNRRNKEIELWNLSKLL